MERTVRDILEATGGTLLSGREDTVIRDIALDSRRCENSALFIPIRGERVDGHDFIDKAFEGGAAASLTARADMTLPDDAADRALILVKDTVQALQDIGRQARSMRPLPIVGVTGSVGKTSTREMIACALRSALRTFSTTGNHNGQLGVPIMLAQIAPEDEAAVLEMGVSMPGEMPVLADMVRPDAAVVTNIGVSHIENLGSREGICREKLHILDSSRPDAPLIVNADDELLMRIAPETGHPLITYGRSETADMRAADEVTDLSGSRFTAVCGEERVPVRLSVPGAHHIMNALAALCAARWQGIPLETAAGALTSFHGFARRQEISQTAGRTLIDDSYNASPDSMRAALAVLSDLEPSEGGRRIAVLADMLELGPDEAALHRSVGEYLAGTKTDLVILIGRLAPEIAKGCPDKACRSFASRGEALGYLLEAGRRGDVVLFKGSNGMKLNEMIADWKAALGAV